MKIKITKDFRNQKAGWEYDFSKIKDFKFLTIVGNNGSGKSTILQTIRGSVPTKSKSLYEADYKRLAENVEITHDYENILFLDAVKDNGNDFMNAYDAVGYFESGGFAKKNSSHGEGALIDIARFMDTHKEELKEKTLVVLDEVDNGLSTANMVIFINFIYKLTLLEKCDVLVVSHNPFFIIQSILCYDISKRKIISSSDYIKEVTGYEIKKIVTPEKKPNEKKERPRRKTD